ncbi:hypothetical protein FQN54_009053 [Arachnomyces sp. PD_36]|nr:hypothetical protein FQN54_009053 [Arachnomyces sp. PD_36]
MRLGGQFSTGDGKVQVTLPEVSTAFLEHRPRLNPHYLEARAKSEDWLIRSCGFDDRISRIIRQTDFSFFCAIVIPDVDLDGLRLLCDWGNFIFPLDDSFDCGDLKTNPEEAQNLVDGLITVMNDGRYEPNDPLLIAFKSIWLRFSLSSSKAIQGRFISRSAYELELPDTVIQDPGIRTLEKIATEIIVIQNDIMSYCKESDLGESYNLVSLFYQQGVPTQPSFECVGDMLGERHRRWNKVLKKLPTWGEEIDRQVGKYIGGIRNVVTANNNWSHWTERYWGGMGSEERRPRTIKVTVEVAAPPLSNEEMR